MNFFRPLMFDLWYLLRPPWDSGIVPPEVEQFIATHPATGTGLNPHHALDLGCGTGTSSLALARAGWAVTGVDFAWHAIRIAKRKSKNYIGHLDFIAADVTHLPQSLFTKHYSLVLDVGCFHGLSPYGKDAYLDQLDRLLAPGGTWLMYGFFKPGEDPGPGLAQADLNKIPFKQLKRQDGTDKKTRPSAWFWYMN